jgi:hypothetical protein
VIVELKSIEVQIMKTKTASTRKKLARDALQALRRAAKRAVELGRRTGTPAYVLENGRIVDAAKPSRTTRKSRGQA